MTPDLPSDGAKRSTQYIQQKVGVLFVQAHRRRKSDSMTIQTAFADQQSHISARFHQLGALCRCRFFRCAVFHQLNSQEQAFASHVTDEIVLCF
jgi:hypothetical protein